MWNSTILWLTLHERTDEAFTVAECANAEQPHRPSAERPDVLLRDSSPSGQGGGDPLGYPRVEPKLLA
jgi:hypothetical protein